MRTTTALASALFLLLASGSALAQPVAYCDLSGDDPFATFPPVLETDPGAALAAALANDANRVVSRADAARIVDAAVAAIGVSSDPRRTHENNLRILAGAAALSGSDGRTKQILSRYAELAAKAIAARLDELEGTRPDGVLPPDAKRALQETFDGIDLSLGAVKDTGADFYEVDYTAGTDSATAYLSRVGGTWIASPVKLTRNDLDKVTEALRAHYVENFLANFRDDLESDGVTEAEINGWVESLVPERAMWTSLDQTDPIGLSDTYPVVFESGDPMGSDNAFYVGYDPATGESEVGDFN